MENTSCFVTNQAPSTEEARTWYKQKHHFGALSLTSQYSPMQRSLVLLLPVSSLVPCTGVMPSGLIPSCPGATSTTSRSWRRTAPSGESPDTRTSWLSRLPAFEKRLLGAGRTVSFNEPHSGWWAVRYDVKQPMKEKSSEHLSLGCELKER
jgi:hypothetical protein